MTKSKIGSFELPVVYESGTRHLTISQLNAQAITQQALLATEGLDEGMAYSIQYYQQLAKKIANQFTIEIQPVFIKAITDASDFSNITQALIKILPANLTQALKNEDIKDLSVSMVNEVRKRADDIEYQTNVLLNKVNLFDSNFNEFRDTYDAELLALITAAGDAVVAVNEEIDEVSEAITQNINDVVKGAETLTEGIAKLGVGTLTKLSGIASKKEDGKEDKDKDKKEEASDDKPKEVAKKSKKEDDSSKVSADFVIESIKLSADGVSQSTTATKKFATNLDKLSDLYQQLAATQSTIAVAKVVQKQNNFFYESVELWKADVANLTTNWGKVNSAFSTLISEIKAMDSKQELQDLIDGVEISKREWNTLDDVLKDAKTVLTS